MLESMAADTKFNTRMSKKYEVDTDYFLPMNSSQLTGVPSWRHQQVRKAPQFSQDQNAIASNA